VRGVAVEHQVFELVVRIAEDGAARGLVHAPRLHAHQPVFDQVHLAHGVARADLVERGEKLDRL
jgi:hypothetical protein